MPRFSLNLRPWVEKLTIQKKDLTVDRLDMSEPFAWAQNHLLVEIDRQYNLGHPVRIIILKARQLGISTLTEAVLFVWCFIHEGANSLVIAHEKEASESIFEKTQLFWETWPFRLLYHSRYLSQKRLSWKETRSSMRIATARNVQSGRGRTLHAVHASECAFWEDAETLMIGLSQTVPHRHGTIVVLESTANGVGNWFYNEWMKAELGDSDYVPMFFPWFKHPEYSIDSSIDPQSITKTERNLLSLGCTTPNLIWRRWAIRNLCNNDEEYFKQEYPATPEEAFLTTGRNVFPLLSLETAYEPKPGSRGFLARRGNEYRFVSDPTGPVTIFSWPSKDQSWGQYFVAGDPSHTTMGDRACIQVINRRTFEQVACWHGYMDPISFAEEIAKLGFYYNNAEITTEIEGPGYATIGRLIEMGYPRIWKHRWADKSIGKTSVSLGWSTNYQRKHWAMGQLIWLLGESSIHIHDKRTYVQMRDYVVLENGAMGPADPKGYDDAVMALAIACVCSMTEGPVEAYESPVPGSKRESIESADLMGIPPWEAWGGDRQDV
ncbi:MAG: hypothetical protein ACREBW_01505 [Candidatus Micrarchaeaceae archaeon]